MGPEQSFSVPPDDFTLKTIQLTDESAVEAARLMLTASDDPDTPAALRRLGYQARQSLTPQQNRGLFEKNAKLICDRGFEVMDEFDRCLQNLLRDKECDVVAAIIRSTAMVLSGDYEVDRYLTDHIKRLIAQTASLESWLDADRIAPFLDQTRRDDGNTPMEHARELFTSGHKYEPTPIRISNRHETFVKLLAARGATTLLITGEIRKTEAAWEEGECYIRYTWWDLSNSQSGLELLTKIRSGVSDRTEFNSIIERLRQDDIGLNCCKLGSRAFTTDSLMGFLMHRLKPLRILDDRKVEFISSESAFAFPSTKCSLSSYSALSNETEDPVLVNIDAKPISQG